MKRFLDKTEAKENGCVEWTAGKLKDGYGYFWHEGKGWQAHRFAWYLENGDIPDKLSVLHKCDNPACVNTYHLFLGTHAENMADRNKKGRQAKGEKNGSARLSEEDVIAIRADKRSQSKIAADYGIYPATVSKIKRRKRWRYLK